MTANAFETDTQSTNTGKEINEPETGVSGWPALATFFNQFVQKLHDRSRNAQLPVLVT